MLSIIVVLIITTAIWPVKIAKYRFIFQKLVSLHVAKQKFELAMIKC